MIDGATAFNNTYQQAVMEKALMDEFHLMNQTHYLEPPEALTQSGERAKFRWFIDSGTALKATDLRPLHPYGRLHPAADRED